MSLSQVVIALDHAVTGMEYDPQCCTSSGVACNLVAFLEPRMAELTLDQQWVIHKAKVLLDAIAEEEYANDLAYDQLTA